MSSSHEGPSGDRQHQQQPKKLRFITNHGAPNPKRRRVSAACLTCRKRKVACSGERPTCNTCGQNKLDCAGYSPGGNVQQSIKPEAAERHPSSAPGNHHAPLPRLLNPLSNLPSIPSHQNLGRQAVDHGVTRQPERLPDILEEKESDAPTSSLFSGPRNRMPYFRWLGPTAIMPGFKQMVVKVNQHETSNAVSSNHSADGALGSPTIQRMASVFSATQLPVDETRATLALPFYDTSSMPPSELITHLCTTFFTHLGCNFPFLQRDRFLQDLQEKQVDTILVHAVCAMAARFSSHGLLTKQRGSTQPSEYGSIFAQRAKEALISTFATPNLAAVQSALLLAYNEFGESRDSGLWMYLGIAIRLAQDLGLQNLDGLCYEGRDGPTPKMVKDDEKGRYSGTEERNQDRVVPSKDEKETEEQKSIERERTDTFWAVFFLDRVVSSGTGRRSTLRDKDIELAFPSLDTADPKTGWPSPFPPLIRIVHLYGRVTDLLNAIKSPSDITEDTPRRLADIEARVTTFYQSLSTKLHFQAINFQHYVKAGEGTNFVLLHFWFHTLIVLLHQPTLFKTFEGNMLQLFPNSQQLSMASAKTIADILSYSQLIDTKACLGNPFTTQPIYIAACAFLKETVEQSATWKEQSRSQSYACSRAASRTNSPTGSNSCNRAAPPPVTAADRLIARHTLLATAASQHYQLCYKALESLETYWAGTKYILTVLDQKFKGVGDPLLYTAEEGESALERPNPRAEEAFKLPGWRRRFSADVGGSLGLQGTWLGQGGEFSGVGSAGGIGNRLGEDGTYGRVGDMNKAIGWTLTGTLDSPSTNLAWHFPSSAGHNQSNQNQQTHPQNMRNPQPSRKQRASEPATRPSAFSSPLPSLGFSSGAPARSTATKIDRSWDGHLTRPSSLLNINNANNSLFNPLSTSGGRPTMNDSFLLDPDLSFNLPHALSSQPSRKPRVNRPLYDLNGFTFPTTPEASNASGEAEPFGAGMFGDMFIESRDVDTSLLDLDTLPWFETLPSDGGLLDLEGFEGIGGVADDVHGGV